MDIIERSETKFVSPAFLVKKYSPEGKPKHRMVIDFRHLNSQIQRPNFSPNLFKQAVELIGQESSKFITLVDIKSAFYALNLSKRAQKYTGFTPFHGSETYTFKRLPMGLSISPAKFTSFIVSLLRKIPRSQEFTFPIMDDLLIVSQTESDHLKHIESVLKILAENGLKLSLSKCFYAKRELPYMGYKISFDKNDCPIVRIEHSKTEAITQTKPPRTVRQLRSFLGMILFLSPHLKELQLVAKPLYDLTRKRNNKSTKLPWTDVHQAAFDKLKRLITTAPVLYPPTRDGHMILKVDTSKHGTGAELSQYQNGKLRLISYFSKSLPKPCQSYSPTELELAGILISMEAFRHILSGKHFHLLTDHSALCHIMKAKTIPPNKRIARFLEKLSFFDFTIGYLRGKEMFIPDYLSRHPHDNENDPIRQVAFYDLTKQQAKQLLDEASNTSNQDSNTRHTKTALPVVTRSQYKRDQERKQQQIPHTRADTSAAPRGRRNTPHVYGQPEIRSEHNRSQPNAHRLSDAQLTRNVNNAPDRRVQSLDHTNRTRETRAQ
jgi:hypothetical protein